MKERFLILTALEESWPKQNQPLLFLGEWCRIHSRKKQLEGWDFEILDYPWNNKQKFNADSNYCSEVIELVLSFLTIKLNDIQGLNHSERYWRIIIGPWLINFIPIVFERWMCLDKALATSQISGVIISGNLDPPVPADMNNFSILQETDWWNFHIYSKILKLKKFKNLTHKNFYEREVASDNEFSNNLTLRIIRLKENLKFFVSKMNVRNKNFVITPYISLLKNILLNLKWFQLPLLYKYAPTSFSKIQLSYRDWSIPVLDTDNEFELILKKIIPQQLPIAYLEGFEKLQQNINILNWPQRPRFIWTSNSFYLDEVFKLWAADKVEAGAPLIIGQHGGNYGQASISFPEKHELKICDYYLSWGWEDYSKKIKPIGILKKYNKRIQKKHNFYKALFVISGAPRYSGTLVSMPMAGQVLDYLDDQFEFYSRLSNEVSSCINIRLYPHDYKWNQYERWNDFFPNAIIDNGKQSFNKLLSNSKIVICGWNTTTYLESLVSDIPTIIFWNPSLFELREEARESFEELKIVGIFHETPDHAASHLMAIWRDIDSWWSQPEVIKAKNNFLAKYAKTTNLTNELFTILNEI